MTKLKQGRWVKIYGPGQANYDEKENILNIAVGNNRCQAEATFTVRSYRKAAYWLLKYLECAKANQILTQAAEQIQAAVEEAHRETPEVEVSGDTWNCAIEKMNQGVFKVRLVWTTGKRKKTVA